MDPRWLPCVFDFAQPDVTGTQDCSDALKQAHDAACERGCRALYFPPGKYFAPRLQACGDVIFMGEGQLVGSYRKAIFPIGLAAGALGRGDVSPRRHLAHFLRAMDSAVAAQPAVVAIVGDSIAIRHANSPAFCEQLEMLLSRRLSVDFPGRAIKFCNFAIGGQTWTALNAAPRSNWPAFYVDQNAPWLDYVSRAQPDLLVFAFGMNDSRGLDPGALRAVVNKTVNWPKPPSLLFCINYVPTLMEGDFNTKAAQEGREEAAGYQRSFCRRYDYGLLDFGRQFGLLRDGFDIAAQSMRIVGNRVETTTPWTFPRETRDFTVHCQFPGGLRNWENDRLLLQLSRRPGNVLALERDAETGRMAATVDVTAGLSSIGRRVAETSIDAGEVVLSVAARGPQLTVQVNGETQLDAPVERFGGLFTPKLRWESGATTPVTLLKAAAGEPLISMPQLIDRDLFGSSDYLHPGGGNGRNHLTSLGVQKVMGAVIDITAFA